MVWLRAENDKRTNPETVIELEHSRKEKTRRPKKSWQEGIDEKIRARSLKDDQGIDRYDWRLGIEGSEKADFEVINAFLDEISKWQL